MNWNYFFFFYLHEHRFIPKNVFDTNTFFESGKITEFSTSGSVTSLLSSDPTTSLVTRPAGAGPSTSLMSERKLSHVEQLIADSDVIPAIQLINRDTMLYPGSFFLSSVAVSSFTYSF